MASGGDGNSAGAGRLPWVIVAASLATAGSAALVASRLRQRPAREPATYPPLDVPKPLAHGLWIVDSGPLNAAGMALPLRMAVVRLANGDLLLHSPTHYSADLADALQGLGVVRHLVAPNTAHWLFVADWQRAFPHATVWAAPGLRDRAQVRASGLHIDEDLGDTAPPPWADEIDQRVVPGAAGFAEVWFFHRISRSLLLVDLIENLEPEKLGPVSALLMRAAAATQGSTARYLRPVIRLGRTRAREAVRAALALAPERVVFAHGTPFEQDAAERLRRGLAWLV